MKNKILFISLALIVALHTTMHAKSLESNDIKYYDSSISDMPSNIIPIVFNSQEEFDLFINDINIIDIHFSTNITTGEVSITDRTNGQTTDYNHTIIEDRSQKYGSYTTYKELSVARLNLKTNYTYENKFSGIGPTHPKDDQFTSANPSIYLSGITLGVNIGNHSTYSNISNNKRSIYTVSSGVLEYYIIIQGIGKYMELPYNISHTFNK